MRQGVNPLPEPPLPCSAMGDDVTIEVGDPNDPDIGPLLDAHESEMLQRYGAGPGAADRDPTIPEQFTAAGGGVFLVARRSGTFVAIGGMRNRGPGVVEIKRMYVIPEARGRGIGRRLLEALQTWAQETRVTRIVLETGTKQPEACSLYESAGFSRIEPYGVWRDSPDSICYEKAL